MKTILILVGKTTDKHFQAGINDYCDRIGHYMPFELVTIPESKAPVFKAGKAFKDYVNK